METFRQEKESIPKDTIVTPPTSSGEPGLTLGELEKLIGSR